MSIFDCLPTVEKCCFCISLKWGTVIIAILGILSCTSDAIKFLDLSCTSKKNAVQIFADYFLFVVIVVHILLFITSFVLFAGVFMKKPTTATWFMAIASLSAIIVLIFGVLRIVASLSNPACKFSYSTTISCFFSFLIWVYFIIVVRSYQPQMSN